MTFARMIIELQGMLIHKKLELKYDRMKLEEGI